ncbi:(d)CMP kinase [Paracoccaceae bacterium GXU_MW_L88]
MKFTLAIDGPAAAGKGTLSRELAQRFGFAHLDTGLLYRAVGKKAEGDLERAADHARALSEADLKVDGLRTAEVGQLASQVAVMAEVRQALLEFQRDFACREGGAVLDGRDIGTVICPDADLKLFVTADNATRARRRHAELLAQGREITEDAVLADLLARDERDAGRKDAPMKAAEDAVLLDTTEMTIAEATEQAAALIDAVLASRG